MLENIRKYTGLMVVVLVLLFVGLIFLTDTSSSGSLGGGPPIAKMEGREFTEKDLRHAASSLELAMRLNSMEFQGRTFPMGVSWAEQLITGYYENPRVEFMINRAMMRQHAEQLGIFPSQEAVEEHIKELPYFRGMGGEFDAEKFERLKTKGLGRLSLTNSDFRELIEDELRFLQIYDLIVGEITAETSMNQRLTDKRLQIMDLGYTLVNRSKFEDGLELAEDDIRAYWEENKQRYLTQEQRKVDWLKITVTDEAKLPPLPAEEALPEDATEEQKKAAAAKRSALVAEREADQEDLDALVFFAGENLVLEQIINEQEGADFLAAAKSGTALLKEVLKPEDFDDADIAPEDLDKLIITTGQTEFFTPDAAPAELQGSLKQFGRASGPKTAAETVFSIKLDGDEADKVSNLLPLTDGSAIAFKVTESIAAEPLPYDEARSQARADLRSERLNELVDEASAALIESLREGLASNQSAAEIIERAGYDYQEALAIDITKPAPELPNFGQVFEAAALTNPKQVGEAIEQSSTVDADGKSVSEGKVVFFVIDRRIAISADNDRRREQGISQRDRLTQSLLFNEWIRSKQLASAVEIIADIK